MGCSPWGCYKSDTTERLHFHFHALEKEMATHPSVIFFFFFFSTPVFLSGEFQGQRSLWAAVYGVAQSRT